MSKQEYPLIQFDGKKITADFTKSDLVGVNVFPLVYQVAEDTSSEKFKNENEFGLWLDKICQWSVKFIGLHCDEEFTQKVQKFFDEIATHNLNDSSYQNFSEVAIFRTFREALRLHVLIKKNPKFLVEQPFDLVMALRIMFSEKEKYLLPENACLQKVEYLAIKHPEAACRLLFLFMGYSRDVMIEVLGYRTLNASYYQYDNAYSKDYRKIIPSSGENSAAALKAFSAYLNFQENTKHNEKNIDSSLHKLVNKHSNTFNELLNKHKKSHNEYTSEINTTQQEFKEASKELKENFTSDAEKLLEDYKTSFHKFKENLEDLEALYSNKLGLAAPTSYWSKKRQYHSRSSIVWLTILITSGAAGFYFLYRQAHIILQADQNNYFTVIPLLLIITPVLWALRIASRIFMQHFHMFTQADEKTVQIQTFLALMENKTLEEKDIPLILPIIFSSATPKIEDDVSPKYPIEHIISHLKSNKH